MPWPTRPAWGIPQEIKALDAQALEAEGERPAEIVAVVPAGKAVQGVPLVAEKVIETVVADEKVAARELEEDSDVQGLTVLESDTREAAHHQTAAPQKMDTDMPAPAERVDLALGHVLKQVWDRIVSSADEYGVKDILAAHKGFLEKRPDTKASYGRALADNAQGIKDCAVDLIWRSQGDPNMVAAGIKLLEYASDRGNLQAGRDLVTLLMEGGVNGKEFSDRFLPDYAKDESRIKLAYELAVNLRDGAQMRLQETFNDYSLGQRSADRAALHTLNEQIEAMRKQYPDLGLDKIEAQAEAVQNISHPQNAFGAVPA